MKNLVFLFAFLLLQFDSFSQDNSLSLDRGDSYGMETVTNENIRIPLHTITTDGISVPIYLSYNTRGLLVTEVPSNVGFGWTLHAGGGIEKQTHHLIDESPNGWLFNNNIEDIEIGEFSENELNWGDVNYVNSALNVYEQVDSAPDMFMMTMSNGFNVDYMFDRDNSYSANVIFSQSKDAYVFNNLNRLSNYTYNYNLEDNYYNSDNDYDVMVRDGKGSGYLFRKGVKRDRPWDLDNRPRTTVDSSYFDNYYIHKINTTLNDKSISFEYYNTHLKKFIPHARATRRREYTSAQQGQYEEWGDFDLEEYISDISVEDVSRKDIKTITTDKEIVKFIYKTDYFNTDLPNSSSSSLEHQKFRLIDEIKIFDHNNNYVFGYKFNYTTQTDLQEDFEGLLKLKSIIKYGKNHKDNFVYKKFNYEYHNSSNSVNNATDVFGYYNGEDNNNNSDNQTPIYVQNQAIANKMPSEEHLKMGVLKTITSRNGGKTEFVYQENSFGDIYYGGLLIGAINKYDINDNLLNQTIFEYDEPEGFGLPVYNTVLDQSGPPNMYEKGYHEPNLQTYGWQTYFTRRGHITAQVQSSQDEIVTYYNISSFPYELMRHTPVLDAYITEQSLTLQEFYHSGLSQISGGVIYKKVTEKKINVINNQEERGKIVKYYQPTIDGYRIGSKLKREEIFNDIGKKINETIYNYQKEYLGFIDAFDVDNSLNTKSFKYYIVDHAFILNIQDILTEIKEINYDYQSGSYQNEYKTTFEYLSENVNDLPVNSNLRKLKETIIYFNNEPIRKTNNVYMSEYDFFFGQFDQNLENLYYINPIIEANTWGVSNDNWILESSVAKSFHFNGNLKSVSSIQKNPNTGQFYNESNFEQADFDEVGNLITPAEDKIEFEYDENGLLISQKNLRSGKITVFQRSEEYNGLYVDATLVLNQLDQTEAISFEKKSFENSSTNHVNFSKAFSGKKVFNGSSLNLGNYPSGYVVSFWSYENDSWKYNSVVHQGGDVIVTNPSGSLYLDEVIVRPKHGIVSSKTLTPLIGVTSTVDNRGFGNRVEYDLFGKPILIYDQKGNVLKEQRRNTININN